MRDLISHVGTDYFAFAVTAVIVLVFTLVYLWWNEQNDGKLTCPGLKSADENFGNLNALTHDGGLHQFLVENHKKFGPIFSFYWCKELTVSLASPQLWKEVVTLFDRPVNQFALFKPLIGENSIQYANGVFGRKLRQVTDRYFSFASIKMYFNKFSQVSDELQKKWSIISKDEHIPLRQYMLMIALKSFCKASFGDDYFKTNKEILELAQAYDVCWEDMESRLNGDFPKPGSKSQKAFDDALNCMKGKVEQAVNHRKALKDKSERNFLDILIDDESIYVNEQQHIDLFITFLVGGFHTTGNLLTWCVYYLCLHPEVENKFVKEIEEVLGKNEIKMENIEELTYTRQVIDESLRCSTLAPYAARYSDYDIVVGGHIIPKKTPIILALGAVLQDEEIWTEPQKFNPDRFTPQEEKLRHNLAFQPFGFAGKRKCPGYRLTYYETTVLLVEMYRKFKIKLVEGQKVTMQHRLVTQPKEEIWITVECRL